MTPLERAARALYKQIGTDFDPFNEGEDAKWPEFVGEVRAVIEALREPSSLMTHAAQGESHVAGDCEVDYHGIWASMIDALLAEGA
jgi:hypothetical protein